MNTEKNELFFSNKTFTDLRLSSGTIQALEKHGYTTATEVQSQCIPLAMKGGDIMCTAKTGSGKTIAFLIPAVELLFRTEFSRSQGTGVIIIAPTRELAIQIYDVARNLLAYNRKTCGVIIGGGYRKKEALKLSKGVNLLIATPGRLLDHLKNTEGFNFNNLCMLVIDEADAILKNGFEEELKEILGILPSERQTLLFSATLNKKIENISTLSLKDPIFVEIQNPNFTPTVRNLEQGYVMVEADKKFSFLYTFIKKHMQMKIMVFFSSCSEVRFYSYLLNYIGIPVKEIQGDLKQIKREIVYREFYETDQGILLCTDIAQRGLDFPEVDWIVQYDAPLNTMEYLHRVGRTARGAVARGKSILILLENEKSLVANLESEKEYEFDTEKLLDIQKKFEMLIKSNPALESIAKDAYHSYILSYRYSKLQDSSALEQLDREKIAKSFGLKYPPKKKFK